MAKITKKEYNSRKAEILEKINKTDNELVAVEKQIDNPNYTSLPDNKKILINSNWELLYDKLYDLKQELQELESEWNRRNWTYNDYMQASLIANNID